GDGMSEHVGRPAELDLHDAPMKLPLVGARSRKEYLERRVETRACARRPGDQERPLAAAEELRVEQEEGNGAEMIAVQMRQHDATDAVGVDAVCVQRDQRGGAAIHEQPRLGGLEQETGIESAAGAEGIARSYDREPHRQAEALGRADTAACQRLRLPSPSGTASLAGFMKSTATRPVISATQDASPAMNPPSFRPASRRVMNSWMRGLLASAQAGTCGTSISFIAG